MEKPKCRLCHHKHWPKEPCVFESSPGEVRKNLPQRLGVLAVKSALAHSWLPVEGKMATPQVAPVPGEAKRGRPRIENKEQTIMALKPWLALGMSRSTWYSRQAEKRKENK